jgi:transposase-like protein
MAEPRNRPQAEPSHEAEAAQEAEAHQIDAPPACAVDPDVDCPVCAARGRRVRMLPVKAHYQCPDCHYFDSCCM